jgi:nucleoside-diphosphate-sugar epimerase
MKVLIVGASGMLGSMVLPYLHDQVHVRALDVKPPKQPVAEFIEGSTTDTADLDRALSGMDALLHMAMGSRDWDTDECIASHFDINVKGYYLALHCANRNGVRHIVHTSSLSVYANVDQATFWDEDHQADAWDYYGLTKRLAEEAGRSAAREWGLSVNALRLCLPRTNDEWQALAEKGELTTHTAASDVAELLLAALRHSFGGFQAFNTSGDWTEKMVKMAKAKALLGWEPRVRPKGTP